MKRILSKLTLITLLVFSGNSIMAQDSIPKQEHNYKMQSPKSKMHSPKSKMRSPKGKMRSPKGMQSPKGRILPMVKDLMESLSDKQKELLAKEKDILQEQRKVLKDMLSNIQKETLKDSSLSFAERKHNIMSKMKRKQRKLVHDFENRIRKLREEFRKSLSKEQIDIITKTRRKSKRYD